METTLVLIKPDAIHRGLMGRVISRLEEKGLKIAGAKMVQIDEQLASRHYAEHVEKPFYPSLLKFITSTPVLALAVRGEQAISVTRALMGKTAGYEAEPGSIRGDFSNSKSSNLVHGSDSAASAERELALFFDEGEVFAYERAIDGWIA